MSQSTAPALTRSPAVDPACLGMLVFISAETMLFAGFVAAYMVFRLGAPAWPPPGHPGLPIGATAFNTALLLASGLTMRRAAAPRATGAARSTHLGLTALLGAGFLLLQGREWARLLAYGLTFTSGTYGATLDTLVGAHALHVAAALAALVAALVRRLPARRDDAPPRALAIYWWFVVALWPVLYVALYLV